MSTFPYFQIKDTDLENQRGFDNKKFEKYTTQMRVFNFVVYHDSYAVNKEDFLQREYSRSKNLVAKKMLEILYYEFGCPDLTNANKIVGEMGRRVRDEEGDDCDKDEPGELGVEIAGFSKKMLHPIQKVFSQLCLNYMP